MLKILAIGDTANLITDLKKYFKKSQIQHIIFPREQKFLLNDKDTIIINSSNFFDRLKKVNSLKESFDLCLVVGWSAARLAYFLNLNYIIYFVGNDLRSQPFANPKQISSNFVNYKLNFLERSFHKKVLQNAVACVTGGAELYSILKKYRKDAIRIDRIVTDPDLFDNKEKRLNKEKTKFTFFSPQRISIEKGTYIIWKALPHCKADFEILQVEWFDNDPHYEKELKILLKNKPHQVKLIPLIDRNKIVSYYNFADAVIGNMKLGFLEGVGREAALCKKPLLNYTNSQSKSLIEGKEIPLPFVPTSQDPQKVAEIIDKIVQSKEFRDELIDKQYNYIVELTDPHKVADEWEKIFQNIINQYKLEKKSPHLNIFRMVYFLIGRALK